MARNKHGTDFKENKGSGYEKNRRTRILSLFFKYENYRDLKYVPLKISLVYLIFGFMWVFFSDDIISTYIANDKLELSHLQTYKGWFYVFFTAAMLYYMIKRISKIIYRTEVSNERSYKKLAESQKKLKESMKQIKKYAYYDFLTGLPNKAFMLEKIDNILKESNEKTTFSLLFLDLDNFKMINDILGHDYGDQLLKTIAIKLKKCIGKGDILARLGGDEFLILLTDKFDKEKIESTAGKIINIFSRQCSLSGKEFSITASMGIVRYPYDGTDVQTLYKNADTAMYQVKEKGKNGFLFFSQDMNDRVSEKLDMENRLRKAIKNEEFVVYYQPQIDIETMQVRGVEALVRWNHPTEGILQPSEFIPAAEESGLIIEIDEFVMRTACKQLKKWIDSNYTPITISINLTSKQFQHANITSLLREVIMETGLEADFLEIEITESIVMEDLNVTLDILKDLKEIGVKISLDDFGTGYSSLNYLKRLPIDTIKIDKSFINEITEDSKEEAIAESIIALAHKMKLSVVAEGIETKKQLEFIKEHKCDKAQGYYFSKPLPVEEIEKMLTVSSIYKV
ncbi:MAG TPA: EAL domain-containing protein [Pseudobacteroides sp.]|uniref:putative bifunctional diguanylate cyclase/phosphodiesterase n=1 Tax=Pseudobacteroides sp. TaxID=1968840 RepID=UPI002F92ABF4